MATLQINGQEVTVDDSFLSLSPDQQNETVDEIAKSLGVTPQKQDAPKPSAYNPYGMADEAFDFMTAGGVQKASAAGLGLVGGVADLVQGKGFQYSDNYNRALEQMRADQEAWRAENPGKAMGGKALGFGLGVGMLPGIGTGVKGAAATGAAYGGATGALQDAGSFDERAKNIAVGAGMGGLLGGTVGTAVSGAGKLLSPSLVSPQRAQMASLLEAEGVPLTAGQKSNNKMLQYAESELGGAKSAQMMDDQAEKFTQAALRRANVKGDRATTDVIDNAFTDVGQRFDGLAARNAIAPDQQIMSDLVNVAQDYGNLVSPSNQSAIVKNTIGDIMNHLQNGGMSGAKYKALRSDLGRAQRSTTSPELKDALGRINESMDDAMERWIAANNPADAGEWAGVRNDYRNLLVIERAATSAGADTAMGLIAPHQLRTAAITKQGRRNAARGKGDFTDLANAGAAMMAKLPQSGTAPRTAVRNIVAAGPAVVGSLLGSTVGPVGLIAGGLSGAIAPSAMGRVLMSGPVQRHLSRTARTPKNLKIGNKSGKMAGLLGSEYYLEQ